MGKATGGLYSERPDRSPHILGVELGHDRGLALVYGAALAGWSYLVSWGALRALDVSRPRAVGGILGVCVGLLVVAALVAPERAEHRAGRGCDPSARADLRPREKAAELLERRVRRDHQAAACEADHAVERQQEARA